MARLEPGSDGPEGAEAEAVIVWPEGEGAREPSAAMAAFRSRSTEDFWRGCIWPISPITEPEEPELSRCSATAVLIGWTRGRLPDP